MFVLDTNILIYYFKNMGNVTTTLLRQPPSSIFIPTVVIYELEVGIAKSTSPQKRQQQLQRFLNNTQILPFGLSEARSAAFIRSTLEQKGQPIGQYDTLIAATALANGMILITHNTREFGRVPGLQIQDWF